MATRLIFVCHGQLHHEKKCGETLAEVINAVPGFRAFFAENVHDTDGLSEHIFGNLERCDGFLAVMNKRGSVLFKKRRLTRSSVWIQQELAIVSFLNFQRQGRRRIRVRVFAQRGITREGLTEVLILNPTEFNQNDELPEAVREWLTGPDFAEDPIESTREGLFRISTAAFSNDHWRYLEVLMALSGGKTEPVRENHALTLVLRLGVPDREVENIRSGVEIAGLIKRDFLEHNTIVTDTLTPGFIDLVADELRRRGTSWRR